MEDILEGNPYYIGYDRNDDGIYDFSGSNIQQSHDFATGNADILYALSVGMDGPSPVILGTL